MGGNSLLVIPIWHPAAIVRGAFDQEPAQIEFLRRAWSFANGAEPPVTDADINSPAPGYWGVAPDTLDVPRCREYFACTRVEGYAVDIEAAGHHLVFIGFCSLETEQGLGIRFRGLKGVPSWPHSTLYELVETLYEVIADPEIGLWFHNGPNYDVPQLERTGFKVGGLAGDTMWAAGTAFSELPRSLEFLSTFYCGIPMWKHLVDTKDLGDNK